MTRWILKRLLNYVVTLFIATSIGYFLASAFLNPRANFAMVVPPPPESSINFQLDAANINDRVPVLTRYWNWLRKVVLHWDWGTDPSGGPVNAEIWHRAVISVELVFLGTVLGTVLGIALGVVTAVRKYKLVDRVMTNGVTLFFFVTPTFVLAQVVILAYLYLHRHYGVDGLFVTGLGGPGSGFGDYLRHIALPTVVLTLAGYASYHLTQRTFLLDTINADYVRTARAKGVRKGVAIRRHALRMSFIPSAYGIAFSMTLMVTGVVFVESIFAIDGAGLYFLQTLKNNDINGAVAILFLGAAATCAGLWLADILVAIVDPRTRIAQGSS